MKHRLLFLFYLLSLNQVLKSQWNYLSTPQTSNLRLGINCLSAPKPNVVWASTFDTTYINPSNQYFRTIDNGVTWTASTINTPVIQMDITSISAVNKDTAWVALNKHGGGGIFSFLYSRVLKTIDGGINWNIQSSANYTGPTNHINFIHFSDSNNGICVGDSNTGFWEIYKTIDGGSNWNRITQANIPANNIQEKGVENCFSIYQNTIWFGTNAGRIYKSTNDGATWNVYNTPVSHISNISMKDSLNGLASNGTTIIRTSDGGLTWVIQPYTGKFFTTDFSVISDSTNTYVSGGWGSGNYGSSYSTNGGLSWTIIDSTFFYTNIHFENHSGWAGSVSFFGTSSEKDMQFFTWSTNSTGLKNIMVQNEINIYPNPFTEELNLKIDRESFNKSFSIEICNVLGILVKKTDETSKPLIQIDTKDLPNGTYIIQVKNGSDFSRSYKVIK